MTVADENTDQLSAAAPSPHPKTLAPEPVRTARVLIVDDHPVMCTALRTYVNSTEGLECVAEARNGLEAVHMCRDIFPDVVIMDLHMPKMDGIEATSEIRSQFPDIAVMAVTTFSTERYVIPALRAGAGGYIVKDAEPDEIIEALRQVLDGAAPLSPAVAHQLMVSVKNDPAQIRAALLKFPDTPVIPSRELQGLQLLASGCSNSEIARHMLVSEGTIKVYMGRLMHRLQVRDRVQLLIRAVELGLVEPALS